MIMLGDLMLVADAVSAKFVKALAVVASELHPTYARCPWIAHPDKSKESCILASLTVRDFLRTIGIPARVREVCAVMLARRNGVILHSLGVGAPDERATPRPGCWNGHMVVLVPSASLLIDTTLYSAIRPAWPLLPPMIAVPYQRPRGDADLYGLRAIAGVTLEDDADGYEFGVTWLDHPANRHPPGGDEKPWRRTAVVKHLIGCFGEWREAA